jgi:predicted metal-dependent peptidase
MLKIHPKLEETIKAMLSYTTDGMPYYGQFLLHVNFYERKDIPTCAVNVTKKGMNFYYNTEFLNKLTQLEVNFVVIHEIYHLLWNHCKRTVYGNYIHKSANYVQDMIINYIIVQDIPNTFVSVPKKDGKNNLLFTYKEYEGRLIFEEMYEWFEAKRSEHYINSKKKKGRISLSTLEELEDFEKELKKEDESDFDSIGNLKYGPYGKYPTKNVEEQNEKSFDTFSLANLFDNYESDIVYLDVHIPDEVSSDVRESMVKNIIYKLKARGYESGNVTSTLEKLRKQRKDHLSHIKRSITNHIYGNIKESTITRPNRRGIEGLKGKKKHGTEVNIILDTSGSMSGGLIEKVLNYVYREDISVNLIECDAKVTSVKKMKSGLELSKATIVGGGGTVLQFGIDYIVEKFNNCSTVILTDGYTDSLNLEKLKKNVLVISIGVACPITSSNGKLKQILVDD